MIVWRTVLLVTVVLTSIQFEKYIVMLKTPQTSLHLGKRQESNSELDWALALARAYDPDDFVGSAVSNSIITHVYNFGKGIIGFAIRTTKRAMEEFGRHPNVAYWGLDDILHLNAPASPMTLWRQLTGNRWHHDRINQRGPKLDGIYPVIGNQGNGIYVYMLDAGVNPSHPELKGRVFVGHSIFKGQVGNLNTDTDGHGTHGAATIVGKTVGLAPKATIISMQVVGPDGNGYTSDIIQAFEHIAKNGVAGKTVVSISVGGVCLHRITKQPVYCMNPLLTSAVEQVVNKMIPIVASAGNDDQSACFQNPGSEPLVFTVGATDNQDNKLTRSNHGSCLDIFVPGGGIESAHPTLGYVTKSGTSMAAPLQAGVFAALLSTYSYPNIDALYKQVIDWSTKGIVQCIPNIETPNRLLYVPFPKWEPQPKL